MSMRSPSMPAAVQTGFHVITPQTDKVKKVEMTTLPSLGRKEGSCGPCRRRPLELLRLRTRPIEFRTRQKTVLGTDTQQLNHRPRTLPMIPAPTQSHFSQSSHSSQGGIHAANLLMAYFSSFYCRTVESRFLDIRLSWLSCLLNRDVFGID